MNDYPQSVAMIANDYLARVKSQLRLVPAAEQDEFVKEIGSHIYEAYQQTPGPDEVARILAVLRNLGEPADVVSDRLPGHMVRSGASRNLPLRILGGILIALFGIPLGIGGVGVLAGMLITLAGVVAAYYAAVGVLLLGGGLFATLGMIRIYRPEFWDKLVASGIIQMDVEVAEFLELLSPGGQGILILVIGVVFIAGGLVLFRLGKHLVRGTRFLYGLAFDWLRKLAQEARGRLRQGGREALQARAVSFAGR